MDGPLDSKTDFTFNYQSNVTYTMFKLTVRIQGRMILCFPEKCIFCIPVSQLNKNFFQ